MGIFGIGVYKSGEDPGAESMTANYILGVFQSIIFIIGIFLSGVYLYNKKNNNAFPQPLFKGIIISNLLTSATQLPHSIIDLLDPRLSSDMFKIKMPLSNGTHFYEYSYARDATLVDLVELCTSKVASSTSWSFCFMLMVTRCIKIRYPFYYIQKRFVTSGIVFIATISSLPDILSFSYTYQPYWTFYTSYMFLRFTRGLIGVQIADGYPKEMSNLTYDLRKFELMIEANTGINPILKLAVFIPVFITFVIYAAVCKHILSLLKNLRNDQNRETLKKSTKAIVTICTTNFVTNLVVILSAIVSTAVLPVLTLKYFNKTFLNWTYCYGPYLMTVLILTSASLVQPALLIVTDPDVKLKVRFAGPQRTNHHTSELSAI